MKLSTALRRRAFPLILVYSIASILCCLTVPMATGENGSVIFSVANVAGGVPAGELVTVDIYVDAPEGTGFVAWVIDVEVDPNVLEPGFVFMPIPTVVLGKSGGSGYFLYDWATSIGTTTSFDQGVRNVTAGTITYATEATVGYVSLPAGTGASGAGKLVTFFFKSKSATAYSPIKITRARYGTSWNNPDPNPDEREPDVIVHGRYPSTYDVAVTSVSAPSQATAGDIVPINVTATNHLDDYAGLNLALTRGTTAIETRPMLLANATSKTESFTWNTTGLTPGEYVINATATVPYDVDLTNNFETTTIKLNPVIFLVTVGEDEFNVVIESNSTISAFEFRQGDMEIRFNVTGLNGTVGFCNVTIDKELLWLENIGDVWVVLIDGVNATDLLTTENATHAFLYFTYTHTTHSIIIRGTGVVPEFPTLIPLLLTLVILAVSTIVLKRRTSNDRLTRRFRRE